LCLTGSAILVYVFSPTLVTVHTRLLRHHSFSLGSLQACSSHCFLLSPYCFISESIFYSLCHRPYWIVVSFAFIKHLSFRSEPSVIFRFFSILLSLLFLISSHYILLDGSFFYDEYIQPKTRAAACDGTTCTLDTCALTRVAR
jgi:hypothetical protein